VNVIRLPAVLTAEDIAALKAENASAAFVQVVPMDGAPVTEASGETASLWISIIKSVLHGGRTLLVPGPWAAWVDGLIDTGVDDVTALILKAPITERWTINKIRAARAAVQDPQT
jgi:hypothetical protein